ncbi:uncharacterized protein A1O5_02053 [Cladophialophora psammophila CBS 110553]|uniref:Uncharacterized protein n=1 Tax=Cladophialophora psammophila CBS 110553 TaxID=1182543 RepID=W9X4F6_9EURO|nr:uncharacterized protein A1O5_02053 [Cladophialophora psammophila CBS 110553]EXJ75357.1 hypothetical protein A1O5_02053 [Cladophialophora psammophila CBS 110553]
MGFAPRERYALSTKDVLSWIFDDVKYDPDKPVYIDAANVERSISSRKARTIVRQLAAGFDAAGLQAGDCVCLHAFNDIYYPLIVLGIIATGGVFAGTNPAYTEHELKHALKTAAATWLISEPELLDPLHKAARNLNIADSRIWIFDPLPNQQAPRGWKSWRALLEHGEKDWIRFNDLERSRGTIAMRLFSSGTTGLPKAVDVSHYNVVAQHDLIWGRHVANTSFDDIHLFPLPMFHAAIAFRAHTSTLKEGEKTYIMRRFDLEQFLANLERYQVTCLGIVPTMALNIIKSPHSGKYSMKSVRWCMCGAAPLRPETQAQLQQLLSEDCPVTQVWGMTESSCSATRFEYPEKDATGSIGRLIPNLEMKLVDDDGNDLGEVYNTRGEMCLRGPTIVPGYYNNPSANAQSFDSERFYHTGDIGYCDGTTKLWYIVDRKKELIKVRGFQVAPPEIEEILLDHPDIVDCAVIGVQHLVENGEPLEAPRAYVMRREGCTEKDLDEKAVKDYIKPKLARYKWLDGGVRFVDLIPRSANGKILKNVLRDEATKESAGRRPSKL